MKVKSYILLIGTFSFQCQAALFMPGNIIVGGDNTLYEYTVSGELIQSINIPSPNNSATEYARDFVVRGKNTYVYNGTFDPYLSTYNSASNSWSHVSSDSWSTVNNLGYGGIDVQGNYAYVTSMLEFDGIHRINMNDGSSTRFATGTEMIDLTIGQDGLLYGLSPGGSPGGRFIDVFDPLSLEKLNTLSLSNLFGHTSHSAITADAQGNIFIADADGELRKIDNDGNLLAFVDMYDVCVDLMISGCTYSDIDLASDGRIVLGDNRGNVILTDTEFSSFSGFEAQTPYYRNSFVAFASPVPIPASIYLFISGMIGIIGFSRRKSS